MASVSLPVALNDILEMTVGCYFEGQQGLNILGFRVDTVTTPGTTLTEIVEDLDAIYEPIYVVLMANGSEYVKSRIRRVAPSRSPYFVSGNPAAFGSAGPIAVGRQLCGMITKQSLVAGRKGRGRVYVPFPCTDDQTNVAIPSAGYMTRLGTLAAALQQNRTIVGAVGTCTVQPVIINRVPFPGFPTSTDWINSTARQKWATHRSRGSYGASNPFPF